MLGGVECEGMFSLLLLLPLPLPTAAGGVAPRALICSNNGFFPPAPPPISGCGGRFGCSVTIGDGLVLLPIAFATSGGGPPIRPYISFSKSLSSKSSSSSSVQVTSSSE